MVDWILRRARLATDATLVDIALHAGQIVALSPNLNCSARNEWDLNGRVVLPGLIDAHTHLDKSYIPARNRSGTLREAIERWHAYKVQRTQAELQDAVRRALRTAIANGVTAMRSHVDVEANGDLQTVATILEIRAEFRDQIDLQLVGLGYAGGSAENRATLRSALDLGLDLIGGAPALADDPAAEIDASFALAEKVGKSLDLHIDETEDPNSRSLDYLATKTQSHGLQGQVTAGHCCSLAFMGQATAERVMENVTAAQLHIVTLPSCNLVLMGREQQPLPRGITRVKELLARGINVVAASDNVQDPFNPFGSYDLLQIANLTAHTAHLSGDDEMREALTMVCERPARTLGLADHGLAVGATADLVVVDCTEPLHAVTTVPPRLATFKRGQLLTRTHIEQRWYTT